MVKDLKIVLNQAPGQIYTPGAEVSGVLSFVLDEAKSYNFVRIGLHGTCYVRWSESHGTSSTHVYSSTDTYVEQTTIVWSKEQSPTGTIGPGSYEYQFQFTLPVERCPASLESRYGRVQYLVQGRIGTGSLKFDHRIEEQIQVTQVVDINPQLQLFEPVRQSNREQVGFLCCVSGDIELSAETTRTGYCINGDTIPLTVTVENGCSRTIRIRASIIKACRYYSQGTHQRLSSNPVAIVNSQPIEPRTTTAVELPVLKVPETEPTNLIPSNLKLFYELHVTAYIPWLVNLTAVIPLVLGNVPYRSAGSNAPPPPQSGLFGVQPSTAFSPPPPAPSAATQFSGDSGPLGFVVPSDKPPDYTSSVL